MKSNNRMRHLLTTGVAALSLAAAALHIAAPVANAEASWCRPWAFVGVPGSNQGVQHDPANPWGKEVKSILDNFLTVRNSSDVMKFPIDYPAALVPAYPDPQADYMASRSAGLYEIKRVMNVIVDSCPNARIVLAGYSQGADIASRIINFAGWAPRARIYRVALIGNPVYKSLAWGVSVPVGGAMGSVGHESAEELLGWDPKVIWDAYAESRIKDVCIAEDIACDMGEALEGLSFWNPTGSHGSYTTRLFPGAGDMTITQWLGKRYLSGAWQPS